MADDEEDDYMGDLSQFLPQEEAFLLPKLSSDEKVFRTKGIAVPNIKNKKRKAMHWQDEKKLKMKQKQMKEDEQTLVNMESTIPQSNIGFKLLKQMGYTPGSSLGKDGSGRAEPLGLEIKRGRAGIGKEDPIVEKMRREEEMAERMMMKEKELMVDFGGRVKDRWKGRRVLVNYGKAEAALAQLEDRDFVEVEKNEEHEDRDGDGDGEKKDEEEKEEITEEDLQNILMKLRDKYYYCLFCGCQYESTETLLSNCPGINEDDH